MARARRPEGITEDEDGQSTNGTSSIEPNILASVGECRCTPTSSSGRVKRWSMSGTSSTSSPPQDLRENADYYQLLAYATALGLPEGLLIYCQADGTVPDGEITVRNTHTSLRTRALDLSGTPAEAEAAVEALAGLLLQRALVSESAA